MYRILFAHPDPKTVAIYESYLSPHFSFDSASDGLAALRKIKVAHPHLVVSDYNLPTLSGLSLLKFIRSHENIQGIPFLFFSDHEDLSAALNYGASEWVSRKTSPQILLDRIHHHLKINKVLLNQIKQYGI